MHNIFCRITFTSSNTNKTRKVMKNEIAFDDTIQKWVVFYTTDRIDYDFETGQQLEPIMCDYHTIGTYDTKEEAKKHQDNHETKLRN